MDYRGRDEEVKAVLERLTTADWQRPLRYTLVSELLDAFVRFEVDEEAYASEEPLLAEALLRDAVRERATDIHIDAKSDGWLVRLRIDGHVLDGTLLDHDQGQRLSNQFKALAKLSPVTRFVPEEGRITYILDGKQLDLRLAQAPCLRGDKLSIRVFSNSSEEMLLSELGLEESGLGDLKEWLDDVSGMLLVCGPTGSGKTTTLYTMLHQLKLHERNVMTIEDPVEYEIEGINHIQLDSRHGMTFNDAIKSMLRLDPDYLMVGEIRDAASADAAVTAASSGHALMSTLHSRDAVGAVEMLRNYGINGLELSSTLMLIVAQRLVRKLCTHCCVEEAPTEEEREWLERLSREVPETVWHARGCEECNETGYFGRTGVFEVWRINREEYQLILEDADRRSLYQSLARRGHNFLLDEGLQKARSGLTSLDELRAMGGYSALPLFDSPKAE
jgi:general secretion pathway protein E